VAVSRQLASNGTGVPEMRVLLLLACACTWAAPVSAQNEPDPVSPLLRAMTEALNTADRSALVELFSAEVPPVQVERLASDLLIPGAVKTTVRERDRSQLEGAPAGDGYSLIVEFFVESPGRARILTAGMDMRRPPAGDLASWRFVGAEGLSFVDGLYKLRLNTAAPMAARNFEITSEDLVLSLEEGTVYLVESDEGVTGAILLGRGQMTFSPAMASERGQLRLFSGNDTLTSPFERAFVRFNPTEYEDRLSTASLSPASSDPRMARRAEEEFADSAPKSFNVDLQDLSPDDWYLLPPFRDFLAEIDTRRFDTLTYTLTAEQAEDISVFRRKDRRTLALYPSVAKLAARGRFYSDDAQRDYDVLDYSVEASIDPTRLSLRGRARLAMRVRSTSLSTIKLRLQDSLIVTGITSVEYGRLLFLRVRNQHMVVINLPRTLPQDSDLTLVVTYAGTVVGQEPDTDTVSVMEDGQDPIDSFNFKEPTLLLSNRSYWYPQNPVPDYATASLRIVVPDGYTCIGSGRPTPEGDLVSLRDILAGETGQGFAFRAEQPLRYLSVVISRLTQSGEAVVPIENQTDPGSGVDSVAVTVMAHSSLRGQGRRVTSDTEAILRFYSSLMGDAPYTSATVALLESDLPGGHSPAYFAVINTPVSFATVNWRGDPASFDNFPEFFLAHELAHQWWGQAIGWKNYHEQWISEGFAQYFAALYAREARGERVFTEMLRQFRRWSISESDQGPVHLGARLGHVKSEPRVFRALVYNKGAAVLHMLRRLLGDEAFFAGLRRFYMDRRYQKAGTEDFERAMEAASGRVLDRFFERWIYNSGIPRIRYSTAIGTREVLVRFDQIGGLVYDLPVTVSLTYANGRTTDVMVPVTEAEVERSIPTDDVVRRVQVNQDWAAVAEFDQR